MDASVVSSVGWFHEGRAGEVLARVEQGLPGPGPATTRRRRGTDGKEMATPVCFDRTEKTWRKCAGEGAKPLHVRSQSSEPALLSE